jgi:hypothetical protein
MVELNILYSIKINLVVMVLLCSRRDKKIGQCWLMDIKNNFLKIKIIILIYFKKNILKINCYYILKTPPKPNNVKLNHVVQVIQSSIFYFLSIKTLEKF